MLLSCSFALCFCIVPLPKQSDHLCEVLPPADYQIHSTFEVGSFCSEARVDGKLQSTATFVDESTFSASFESLLLKLRRTLVVVEVDHFAPEVVQVAE